MHNSIDIITCEKLCLNYVVWLKIWLFPNKACKKQRKQEFIGSFRARKNPRPVVRDKYIFPSGK